MDRKQKKSKKIGKSIKNSKTTVWYKKHFLLEVLYYVPYVYISLFRLVGKLVLNGITFITNWVKSHSSLAADLAKKAISDIDITIKAPTINLDKFKISKPKISLPGLPKLNIEAHLTSEIRGLKKEVKDLIKLLKLANKAIAKQFKKLNSIEIKLPKINLPRLKMPEVHLPEIKLPTIKWPSINLSLPKKALPQPEVKVVKAKKQKVVIEEPKPLADFSLLTIIKNALKSAFLTILNILLWPFRTVYKILRAIFTFEIRFRLFSFRTILLIVFLVGLYIGSAVYYIVWKDLPKVEALSTYDPRQTTTIYDRKGNILYRLYDDEDRSIVPIKSIPTDLINATVAIEDENFYEHNGLSVKGILRAAKKTFLDDNMEGGSTITQQLVKNSLLTPERTYERKAKEAVIAIEVERKYSKDQILEMYLNRISYGGTAYGIKSAAKRYFDKDLEKLNLAEEAFLAGLPAAPSKYSPFAGNLESGKERQKLVLSRMVASGYITQASADEAYDQKLEFKSPAERIVAPHFVNYVISELENKYGQMMVAQGGLDVFTSIDMDLQSQLEKIVEDQVTKLGKNNVSNGAAVVTDPKTGEILAMVGSENYWDTAHDGNVNIATTPRQPGSSIKPLTYSLALENGYTLNSVIEDEPVVFKLAGQKDYKPVNYDGKFHGRVTLKTALANSYNIPAVKVLQKLGVSNLVDHGKKMGITTWDDSSRFGLALTLGAGEVKMTDMAVLYGVFANQGYRRDLNPILKIYDTYGNIIEENDCVDFLDESLSILTRRAWFETNAMAATTTTLDNKPEKTCQKEKVISPYTAYMISNVLTDNKARSAAFGANSELNVTKKQFAVKTGTTNDEKDNWAIGYNDDFVVVTWVGNNYNQPMLGLASGYVGSSSIWRKAVDYLIDNREMPETISRPAGLVEVDVCPLTNTLACSGCPNIKQLFEKGKEPQVRCDPDVVQQILEKQADKKKDDEDKNKDEENKSEDETPTAD